MGNKKISFDDIEPYDEWYWGVALESWKKLFKENGGKEVEMGDQRIFHIDDCPCGCIMEISIDNSSVSLRHHRDCGYSCRNRGLRLFIEHCGKPFELVEKVVNMWHETHNLEVMRNSLSPSKALLLT